MQYDYTKPVIALCGPIDGIFREDKRTWHHDAIEELKKLKYQGLIYVPCRLDAELGDNNVDDNKNEKKNNEKMYRRCRAIIHFIPNRSSLAFEDVVEFKRNLVEAMNELKCIKWSRYIFCCSAWDMFKDSGDFTFCETIEDACIKAVTLPRK
jgi:hypothetical protein